MMNISWIVTLILAYLLGSLPTALIVSHLVVHADIRQLGDRNMGARNTAHVLGWKAGWVVAAIDISKGACSVWLAQAFGLDSFWQVLTGACVVLGHDFPIFAGFRGGQGLAATIGVFFVLAPRETLYGLVAYLVLYLLMRNFDLSAGAGIALLVFLTWRFGGTPELILGEVAIVLLVPTKKFLDRLQAVPQIEDTSAETSLPAADTEAQNGFQENTTGIHR
jgi:acyl phosphate:glycerol-3-phosphate acyltransferase